MVQHGACPDSLISFIVFFWTRKKERPRPPARTASPSRLGNITARDNCRELTLSWYNFPSSCATGFLGSVSLQARNSSAPRLPRAGRARVRPRLLPVAGAKGEKHPRQTGESPATEMSNQRTNKQVSKQVPARMTPIVAMLESSLVLAIQIFERVPAK